MKQYISRLQSKASQHKTLIQNFSYLSGLQIFNLILPFISYPYLIRVLGIERYGLVVFAQAIIGFLLPIVMFGFNITAVKEVSIHRANKEKLDEIVSSILIDKSILLIICTIILGLLLYNIPEAKDHKLLFLLTMGICLNDVLFPVWYFQGIEQMKYITFITMASRLISISLIFILITKSSDYILLPLINGFSFLISGTIAIYIIFVKHRIRFNFQPLENLKKYILDSIPIFISNISSSLYGSSNKVILGIFLGTQEVAIYDLAEKITTVFRFPQSIMIQSLFPRISKERNLSFIKRIFKLSMISNILLFVSILICSRYIIILLGGQEMLTAQAITNILILTLPLIALSNNAGFLMLIPFGFNKSYSKVIMVSFGFYLIQVIIIWQIFGFSLLNIAIIAVSYESFIAIYMLYFTNKYHLWR